LAPVLKTFYDFRLEPLPHAPHTYTLKFLNENHKIIDLLTYNSKELVFNSHL